MTAATVDPAAAPAAPAVDPVGQPVVAEQPAVSLVERWHLWILLAITLLGIALRFAFPSRPLLWGDDAYTVYRTHADYQSMLDVLQHDGFTPLHYELYWLVGRIAGTKEGVIASGGQSITYSDGLTPAVVRMLPALWGSLMPPVMYFLAVHLVRRRIALVVALFAASSAYLLGYSRDGKMYMMLWMFSALSTACLLWWFRTGKRIAWLSWVAASLAMSSSHMPGVAMLPFQAIFFLTRSRVHWKEAIPFLIGVAIAAAGPAAYITQFNAWAQEAVEDFGFEVEGLGWVVEYNAGRDGPDLLRYATSAYLLSWEWPKRTAESAIQPWILTTLKAATWLLIFFAALGALPWSRKLRGIDDDDRADDPPQPWWRVLLWLGLWLIIPTYFMYCRSVTDFASPGDWFNELGVAVGGPRWTRPEGTVSVAFWCLIITATIGVGVGIFLSRRVRLAATWLAPLIAVILLLLALIRHGIALGGEDGVQRFFRPSVAWADQLTGPLFLCILAVTIPGLIVYYCGTTWPQRAKRVAQFAMVLVAIWLACHLAYKAADAKLQKEIKQYLVENPGYTAEQVKRQLTGPGDPWQSIFMPRYIGFVWVAFCIALCTLYMRLPTRPLRIAAVSLLLLVNLLQFRARLFAGTEPPLDVVAQDVWRHDTTHNPRGDPTGRTYVNDAPIAGPGHPGYGTLQGQQGKYYLGLARGYWFHPTEWKKIRSDQYFEIHPKGSRAGIIPAQIASEVRQNPRIERVVVWEKHFGRRAMPDGDPTDRLPMMLGPAWKRISEADYKVRLHWNWTDLYTYRRTEYVRS